MIAPRVAAEEEDTTQRNRRICPIACPDGQPTRDLPATGHSAPMGSRTSGFDLIRISAAFVIFLGHLAGQNGPNLVPASTHAGLAVML
jgi:hypothetical protein